MLFYTLDRLIYELHSKRSIDVDQPYVLVFNESLERWSLLDVLNDNDKIQYFEDPQNMIVCTAIPSDTSHLSTDLDVDEFETYLMAFMVNVVGNNLRHTLRTIHNNFQEYKADQKKGESCSQADSTDAEPVTHTTSEKNSTSKPVSTVKEDISTTPTGITPQDSVN